MRRPNCSHPTYSHIGYSLTCAEFDGLLAMTRGHCMICKKPETPLSVDHDHELGGWAVRGLVCRSCNQQLRRVDAGEKAATPAIARYLAEPWHLHQPSSATKKARMKPRVMCDRCGLSFAVGANGRPVRHWSRVPGEYGQICGEPQVVLVRSVASPRWLGLTRNDSGCLHHQARIHKGLCYACGTYVGTREGKR